MSRTVELRYVVKRGMKYNGQHLKSGDEWEPAGGKWDDALIAKGYVEAVQVSHNLSDMTLEQLRRHAKDEGVERYWLKGRDTLLADLGGGEKTA
jgi:hypothetical protein